MFAACSAALIVAVSLLQGLQCEDSCRAWGGCKGRLPFNTGPGEVCTSGSAFRSVVTVSVAAAAAGCSPGDDHGWRAMLPPVNSHDHFQGHSLLLLLLPQTLLCC